MARRKTLTEKLAEIDSEERDACSEASRRARLKRAQAKLAASGSELRELEINIEDDSDVEEYLRSKSAT